MKEICSSLNKSSVRSNEISRNESSYFNSDKAYIFTSYEDENKIVKRLIALYQNVGIVPQASNFLFASKNTNKEQITIFVNRCFEKHQKSLFIITNCQDLSWDLQQNLVEMIEKKKENNNNAVLALFHDSKVVKKTYLSQKYQKLETKTISKVNINKYYENFGVSVTFISSELSGMVYYYFIYYLIILFFC